MNGPIWFDLAEDEGVLGLPQATARGPATRATAWWETDDGCFLGPIEVAQALRNSRG
jgi:hypothetical protein